MGAAVGNSVVVFGAIVGAVCGDTADLNLRRDLVQQVAQHPRISDVAPANINGSDFQRFLVDPEVYLALDPSFGATMLAGMPLAFALYLDTGAVDQQVQQSFETAKGDVHGEGLLAARQRAEVGHRPVEVDQAQQALDETGRLAERHAEHHLHRKASLDGGIAVGLLAATPACRRGIPAYLRVELDHQRATALERFIVGRPVPGLVGWACGSAHEAQLPPWTRHMNHSRDLCNRAKSTSRLVDSQRLFHDRGDPKSRGAQQPPHPYKPASAHASVKEQ